MENEINLIVKYSKPKLGLYISQAKYCLYSLHDMNEVQTIKREQTYFLNCWMTFLSVQ